MQRRYRGMIVAAIGIFALLLAAGCATHERKKVTVIEEQHEGEVQEAPPGDEMIVE